ncbi:MAG: hypothetical protein GX639_09040 [Fibrobacter sp.]|nr:hypothetical protein [Fibrobacter sp.]
MNVHVAATLRRAGFLVMVTALLFVPYAQALSGKVIDESGEPIKDAIVRLVNAGLSDTSASDGTWSISVTATLEPQVRKIVLPSPILKGDMLYFAVNGPSAQVKASVYTLSGKKLYTALDSRLNGGFYTLYPLDKQTSKTIYMVRLQIDDNVSSFKLIANNGRRSVSELSAVKRMKDNQGASGKLAKRFVVIDTVKVSKAGYESAALVINSYSEGPLTITLKTNTPSYYLNPPSPCYNQFYVKDCIPGDPKSACGGECTVANSCSPPEDQSKANRPKTFICPRFMLFSTEMIQAAKDDAALYGWEKNGELPFNYAIVGHDPDDGTGGLDDTSSSCCQCYQLVYETPEPSSPKPPELPYPKPLIVQSFNTAASGPKGFDVFMGAGGYGAFNSCYNDPAFSNTTKFNEFIYDKYPYQNPGSGGISFLRYETECRKSWPPTIDDVMSEECQEKIKEMCNQALVNASEQITEDTRRSCILCNQVESLYHQNWTVMVKRVRCPENLTRVTGCRLKEDKLPLPVPDVRTPAQAVANGTFKSGYHTTTMQDCCKPTCAWANWVEGYLPVDGEWNSFYSCDKNGKPFTR